MDVYIHSMLKSEFHYLSKCVRGYLIAIKVLHKTWKPHRYLEVWDKDDSNNLISIFFDANYGHCHTYLYNITYIHSSIDTYHHTCIVCMCLWMHVGTCAYVWTCIEDLRTSLHVIIPQQSSMSLLEARSVTGMNIESRLDWLVVELQGSIYFYLSKLKLTSVCHHAWSSGPGPGAQAFMLTKPTLLTNGFPQHYCIFLDRFVTQWKEPTVTQIHSNFVLRIFSPPKLQVPNYKLHLCQPTWWNLIRWRPIRPCRCSMQESIGSDHSLVSVYDVEATTCSIVYGTRAMSPHCFGWAVRGQVLCSDYGTMWFLVALSLLAIHCQLW